MFRGQQWILNGLALLTLLAVGFLVASNFYQPLHFKLFTVELIDTRLGMPLLIVAGLSILGTVFWMLAAVNAQRHGRLDALRECDRVALNAENTASTIKALEQKNQTLEKALEKTLGTAVPGEPSQAAEPISETRV